MEVMEMLFEKWQLQRIYESVAESIWGTVTESFPSACVTAILVFLIYMGAQLIKCRGENRRYGGGGLVSVLWKGFWLSLFAYYTYMVLYRTLIARPRWEEPLEKIFGSWGLYTEKGKFTTEAIENGMLLFPFTWLFGMVLRERWSGQPAGVVFGRLFASGFLMSLFIETVQVVWNRGTFQFSDLFYNTLGGLLGGSLFVAGRHFWAHRESTRRNIRRC